MTEEARGSAGSLALPDWVTDDHQPIIAVANGRPMEMLSDDYAEVLAEGVDRSDLADTELEELASDARWHREQAETAHRKTLHHMKEVGRRLIEAKTRMPLREFSRWAEAEVGVRQAQAYNLMGLARPENAKVVDALPIDSSARGALDAIKKQRTEDRKSEPRKPSAPVHFPDKLPVEYGEADDIPMGDNIVDLAVFSPPYGLGIEYEYADDNDGYAPYLEKVGSWCEELYRVMAPQGRICVNVPLDITRGGRQSFYSDWLRLLKAVGFIYRTTIVWDKDNINNSNARGTESPSAPNVIAPVEHILVMHKGDWNLNRADKHDLDHQDWLDWTGERGLWRFPGARPQSNDPKRHCPKPFPLELPKRCILLFSYPGDVVLDHFLGSGTTGVAALTLGRQFYGFDHSYAYLDEARERIDKALKAMAKESNAA